VGIIDYGPLMELRRVDVVRDAPASGRVRVVGTVVYDGGDRGPEEVWFEFPERNAEALSQTGNAWLVALLPLATKLGEPLRIGLPVDAQLRRGAVEAMRIWSVWHPGLRVVPIEADIADIPRSSSDRSAALFTAGVDSFFTVLDLEERGRGVDALVNVAGFDIPHDRPDELERLRIALQSVADELGKELLSVTTNLRATRFRETRCGYHSHGAALGSVALAISGTYPKVFCSSDDGYASFVPWGLHPLVDRHWTTSSTEFVHYGPELRRAEKLERVIDRPIVRRSLRVCQLSESVDNCNRCPKCLLTRLHIELLGLGDACPTLSPLVDAAPVAEHLGPRVDTRYQPPYLLQLRESAKRRGRLDLVRAIDRGTLRAGRNRAAFQAFYYGARLLPEPIFRALRACWRRLASFGPGRAPIFPKTYGS